MAGKRRPSRCCAASGRLAGPGVVGRSTACAIPAEHVVVAAGAISSCPRSRPARARGRLEHARGDRHEGGSAKACWCWAAAAGVELAQACVRLGGEVTIVEGASHLIAREPAPLGEARQRRCSATGSKSTSARARLPLDARARTTSSSSRTARKLRGEACSWLRGRRPRVDGLGLETVGVKVDPHGIPVDAQLRAGERCGRSATSPASWPLTHVGKYPGRSRRRRTSLAGAQRQYEAVPRVT